MFLKCCSLCTRRQSEFSFCADLASEKKDHKQSTSAVKIQVENVDALQRDPSSKIIHDLAISTEFGQKLTVSNYQTKSTPKTPKTLPFKSPKSNRKSLFTADKLLKQTKKENWDISLD